MRNSSSPASFARNLSRAALFLLAVTCFCSLVWAQNENETVGFQSHHSFDSGQFGENIDILNGGLSLTVPLGPTYQVNARLGYQIRLAYDSKVWDMTHLFSPFVAPMDQVMPFNESPVGFGFSLHMGRIFIEHKYATPPSGGTGVMSRSYKWVSSDGSQHEFYFDDRSNTAWVPGVTITNQEPIFTNRVTSDGSFVIISGPGDKYCYPSTEHNCFRVKTPDGLVYSLAPRVACPEPPLPASGPDYARIRAEQQSFCGWYTTLVEDSAVGSRSPNNSGDPDAGPIVTPYPNHIKITYDNRPGFEHVMVSVQDSQGRAIAVSDCELDAATSQCRSPQPTYTTTNPANRHAVAVTSIDVPGSGTTLAGAPIDPVVKVRYALNYGLRALSRPNPNTEVTNSNIWVLTSIDYPEYGLSGGGAGPPYSLYFGFNGFGELGCRTLPVLRAAGYACGATDSTKVAIHYEYNYYTYVSSYVSNGFQANCNRCGGLSSGIADPNGYSRQLVRKTLETKAGNPLPTWSVAPRWTYSRTASNSTTNPTKVKVSDPFGNDTIYYYHASTIPPSDAGTNGADPEDGYAPEWDDGVNYRVDYFQGPEETGRIVRSEVQTYDSDTEIVPSLAKLHHGKLNLRVREAKTLYADDQSRERVVNRGNWDGYGHWRSEIESGFDVPGVRTTQTEYLNISDNGFYYNTGRLLRKEVSDGSRVLSRLDNSYTAGLPVRGQLEINLERLTLPRTFDSPVSALAHPGDLKTKFSYSGTSGNVIKKELWSDATAPVPSYTIAYTYGPIGGTCQVANECGGYLKTKAFQNGAASPWKVFDRDRDGNTGLILATRDSAGLQTTYTYDSLGRIGTITPAGEQISYVLYVSLQQTNVSQGNLASTDYLMTKYFYDTLGRLVATEKRPADPARGSACQRTQYDLDGRATFKSEWSYVTAGQCLPLPEPALSNVCTADTPCTMSCYAAGLDTTATRGTEFDLRDPASGKCDPFGRVRREIPADANRATGEKIVQTDYFGTSSKTTVNGVRAPGATISSLPVSFPVSTTYFRDAFGRLVAVDASGGKVCAATGIVCSSSSNCGQGDSCVSADGGADAYYAYDALDRLEEVDLTDNLNKHQQRSFYYDGLGHLVRSDQPENGVTLYPAYDALGNPLKVQDAKGNLQKFVYDFAGRLTTKKVIPQGGLAERGLADLRYDEANHGTAALGKLTSLQSYDQDGNLLLSESRTYSGIGGRLSQTVHDFSPTWSAASALTTNYTYTSRGELAMIAYPQEASTTRTVLRITYANINGMVTKATESESDTSFPPRDLGVLTYNAAGGVETLVTPGGGKTTITYDERNRPKAITGGLFNSTLGKWSYESGSYAYDGAGNIYQIGSNNYGYDAANRLVSAHTLNAGNVYDETFQYDLFGNMTVRNLNSLTPTGSSENDLYLMDDGQTTTANRILNRQTTLTMGTNSPTTGTLNFEYDPVGNLVYGGRRQTPSDDLKAFEYDPLNRLRRTLQAGTQGSSEADRFAYDTGGNRLWRVEQGTGLQVYSVRDAGGQVLSEFRAPSVTPGAIEWSGDYIYLAGRLLGMKQNQRPRPPVNLQANPPSAGPGWALTWDENVMPATRKYNVYRFREGIDAGYVAFATQPTTASYTDATSYAAGQAVRYQVTCIDTTTTYESQPSAPIRVVAGDVSGPSAPTLSAIAGDRQVTLSWVPGGDASDIAGYEISRRLSLSSAPQSITVKLIAGTSYVDLNLQNGITYFYTVRARDAAGNWGPFCAPGINPCDASATPLDLTPPSPPKNVTAGATCAPVNGVERIALSWDANPAGDCTTCYYDIYRNTEPTFSGLAPIASGVTGTSFQDTAFAPTPGVTYYYAMAAADGPGPSANRSLLSNATSAVTHDASIAAPPRPWANASEGSVQLRFKSPGHCSVSTTTSCDTSPGAEPCGGGQTCVADGSPELRIYRRLNVESSCNDYVYVGSLGNGTTFTDSSVTNNLAYNYAITKYFPSTQRESPFSQPILAIPLARTRNLNQCADAAPWETPANSNTRANIIQWTPPDATALQPVNMPYLTSNSPLGYLVGYHLYHYKICGVITFDNFLQDSSPIREVVFNKNDPRDPYLLRRTDGNEVFQDPRYALLPGYSMNNQPLVELSPKWPPPAPVAFDSFPFSGETDYGGYCYGWDYRNRNCALPKAAYKIFAEGLWLPAESGWPDYFDSDEPIPDRRCKRGLKDPNYGGGTNPADPPPACWNGDKDPNYLPPPPRLSATQTASGAVRLDWTRPRLRPGSSPLAGYYLYAFQAGGPSSNPNLYQNFVAPLPFAKVGPAETSYIVPAEAHSYRVAAFDEAGHVSGNGGDRCSVSGAYCGGTTCPTVCDRTRTLCDANNPCFNTGTCSSTGALCSTTQGCGGTICSVSPWPACTPAPPPQPAPQIAFVQAATGFATNSFIVTVTLGANPTSGNALIAVVGTRGTAGGQVTSIFSDGASWSKAYEPAYAGLGVTTEIWYLQNVIPQGQTPRQVTITVGAKKPVAAVVAEFSGLDKTSAILDLKTGRYGNTGNPDSGQTATFTNKDNELWVGGFANTNVNYTYTNPGFGFQAIVPDATAGSSSTGTRAEFTWLRSSAQGWAEATATRSPATGALSWGAVVATFRGQDPPPPPPDPCPGLGNCILQTCNLNFVNQCVADTCQPTIGRYCQSDNSSTCDVGADCPQWHSGHCSDAAACLPGSPTPTCCDPGATPPTCTPGQVCIPGDSCVNNPQTSTTVVLDTGFAYRTGINNDLPYDATTLPPPQNFRAWAPQHKSDQASKIGDNRDIYLRWCGFPVNPPRNMPTLNEYVVYRSRQTGGPYQRLARISPACLDSVPRCSSSGTLCSSPGSQSNCPTGEMCLNQGNRCEIIDPSDALRRPADPTRTACVSITGGIPNPNCAVIQPTATCSDQPGAVAKPCAIVDLSHEYYACWPLTSYLDTTPYNFYYLVTAKGNPGTSPETESMPSAENAGYLNYCFPSSGPVYSCCTTTSTDDCPLFKHCLERRDPDGNGEYPACSDGRVELHLETPLDSPANALPIWGGSQEGDAICQTLSPAEGDSPSIAPHRVIGAGGQAPSRPSPVYNPPTRFVFYHSDHLGSPRAEIDDKGNVLALHHYLPFGQEPPPVTPDPTMNTRAFTGHERDAESGLDYMLARYYSSSLGRFMAVDPALRIGKNLAKPQRWNRYSYTLNNPIKFVDPDGEDLQLASGLTLAQQSYLRTTLAQIYANPTGSLVINKLEASAVTVVLAERAIDPKEGTGLTRGDLSRGVIGLVVDRLMADLAEKAGGDTPAQNLAEELMHALQLIEKGETGDPDPKIKAFKASIGANSPTEGTRSQSDAVLDRSLSGPQSTSGSLCPELSAAADAADQKKKELEAAGKW